MGALGSQQEGGRGKGDLNSASAVTHWSFRETLIEKCYVVERTNEAEMGLKHCMVSTRMKTESLYWAALDPLGRQKHDCWDSLTHRKNGTLCNDQCQAGRPSVRCGETLERCYLILFFLSFLF